MYWKNLPVDAEDIDQDIGKIYIQERNQIRTPQELIEFVNRWRPMFALDQWEELDKSNAHMHMSFITYSFILKGTFDPEGTFKCLERILRKEDCGHGHNYSCCGMHVAVPYPLATATLVANTFVVPTNVALMQINGGYRD